MITEATLITKETPSNPLGFKTGENAILCAEYPNPTKVKIERVGFRGWMAVVLDEKTKIQWTVTMSLLSRE